METDDGGWFMIYLMIDICVLLLEVSFLIPLICIEIACWILSGDED